MDENATISKTYYLEKDHLSAYGEAVLSHIANGCVGNGILSEVPDWINEKSFEINEPLLCLYLVELHNLKRKGKKISAGSGRYISPNELNRLITDEIGKYYPTNAWSKVNAIAKLIYAYIPEENPLELKITTADILQNADLKKPEFVVNEILPCGLSILAAPPKTGKSWMCLALADAVTTGSTFFGLDTRQGSVLYMALEDSEYRLRERLRKIGSSMPKNLYLVNRGAKKIDDGLCDQINEWIDGTPAARLVIVDTLARVKGSAVYGMNGYEADTQQFAPLQELAINRGVSILVVTHFRKTQKFSTEDPFERISGTTGLFGVSDAAWIISGNRGQEMTLRITGRDAVDAEYKIVLDGCKWVMLGDSEALQKQRELDAYKTNTIAATIRALVHECGRWQGTARDLMNEVIHRTETVPATSESALGKELQRIAPLLLDYDRIMVTQEKGGRKGRAYSFEAVTKSFISK